MEELRKKYQYARKAWDTLDEVLKEDFSSVVRDAAIQRFEYTFETTWKVLKVYLKEREGIIANSPKSVFREALYNTRLTASGCWVDFGDVQC